MARRYAALERRLFEVVGAWVPDVDEPDVKVALRVASFRHAWHAELWEGVVRTGAGVEAGPASLPELEAATSTDERLAAFYGRVLPALIDDYDRLLAEAEGDVAAGGPLRRVLTLVLADDRAELAAGRALMHVQPRGASKGVESH